MPLGIYISVPFCRTKCSYCNFASGVSSPKIFDAYVARVRSDISQAEALARKYGAQLPGSVDSIYLGGGTPSVLAPEQLHRIFEAVRARFDVASGAEITVECAPGTLDAKMIDTLLACGVNRVSLGVQSFVDAESRAVGRVHTRAVTLDDIARLGSAGIGSINVDLIAGLPHQTAESWDFSVREAIATGAPHVSVYMLEVDEDSRLGSELIAGGARYHAHFVPDEDRTADFYLAACDALAAAGVRQYEISNFARAGQESRHNLKYWTRQPYVGFGVDAHSMLALAGGGAVRLATPDSLERFLAAPEQDASAVDARAALEEEFFLGLRLNQGIDLAELSGNHGREAVAGHLDTIRDLEADGLLACEENRVRLTTRGRLLSNEVFERFLAPAAQPPRAT